MKRGFFTEKILCISLISVFCVLSLIMAFKIHTKLEELSSSPAVVIHDVPTTGIEERDGKIVYVTPSGKKYHLMGCSYLGEITFTITKEEAKNSGYESCSRCRP